MNVEKENLREKYRDIRLKMSRNDVITKSRVICRKLLDETELLDIKTVLAYDPIKKLNEVRLDGFLEKTNSPKIDILSNNPSQPLPDNKYNLIIVPVLAFDKHNYRLGWGSGFYDRFLATQPRALKIGLCFQNGYVKDGLPHEPHDFPLDKIITEV